MAFLFPPTKKIDTPIQPNSLQLWRIVGRLWRCVVFVLTKQFRAGSLKSISREIQNRVSATLASNITSDSQMQQKLRSKRIKSIFIRRGKPLPRCKQHSHLGLNFSKAGGHAFRGRLLIGCLAHRGVVWPHKICAIEKSLSGLPPRPNWDENLFWLTSQRGGTFPAS